MTSKKRVDVDNIEEGGEPKRPRGEEEKQETVAEAEAAQQEQRNQSRSWLSYSGRRRPRVGDDFQVTSLPSPSDTKEEAAEASTQEEEGKKEMKEE